MFVRIHTMNMYKQCVNGMYTADGLALSYPRIEL